MPVTIIYLRTNSNIIELYKINLLSKIMPVSNYLFVVIIYFVTPHTKTLPIIFVILSCKKKISQVLNFYTYI